MLQSVYLASCHCKLLLQDKLKPAADYNGKIGDGQCPAVLQPERNRQKAKVCTQTDVGDAPLNERRAAAASAAAGTLPPAAPLHSPSAQADVANYLHSTNTTLEKVSAST